MSNWMEKDMAKVKYWFFFLFNASYQSLRNKREIKFPELCTPVIWKKHASIKRYSFENGGLLVLTVSNKPKALWWSLNIFGLYYLSLLWQHFSKLELQNQRHLHARVQSHKLSIWSWELEKAALFIQFSFCRKF